MEHRAWISAEAALHSAGEQAIKRGMVTLGGVLDRLAAIERQDKTTHIRKALVEREEELRAAARDYTALVHSIGDLEAADRWEDALATCQQKLSAAYFQLLDDPSQATRLIVQANASARDPLLRQAIELDRRHITRYTLCREADALMRADNFNAAEYKLAAALASSTDAEKNEIRILQDRCRWGRALRGVDTSKTNPTLDCVAGIGGRLRGERDMDSATQSYVTHHWFTFFFLPVFPIAAYRVSDAGPGDYNVHGRLPLPASLRNLRWAIPALIFAAIVSFTIKGNQVRAANPVPAIIAPTSAGKPAPAAEPAPAVATPTLAPAAEQDALESKPAVPQTAIPQTAILKTAPQASLPAVPAPAAALPVPAPEAVPAHTVASPSLEKQKRALDAESADLERERISLANVAASYHAEKVPQGGQTVYEHLLANYNLKVENHRRKLAEWTQSKAHSAVVSPGP